MKNIFKFMGIALMASAMIMTSCKKDEDKTNTPDNPQPGQASCTITWDGAAANTGVIDGYMYSSQSTVYILIASAGLENDNYTFPIYRFGLDLDIDDLTVADAVVCCISRSHMDVSLGSDNAFFQFDFTAGANQLDAGSAFDITGFSDLGFNTKGSGIGQ